MTDNKENDKRCAIQDVSNTSIETILQCLNNTLKYGKKLLLDCDDDDEQSQIDIWRTNNEVEQAIKEIKSCC